MKTTLIGIPNIRDGFVAGFALGNAAREHGTFSHKHTILVRLDHHSEFHALTMAVKSAFRNGDTRKERSAGVPPVSAPSAPLCG